MTNRDSGYWDNEFLRRIVEPGAGAAALWHDEELADLFQHQLSGPLSVDLESLGHLEALKALEVGSSATPKIDTFGDLLSHRDPPLTLLRLVKTFAQSQLHAPEPSLPRPIALLLYDAMILLARTRHGVKISGLPDSKLVESVRWLTNQPWVDRATGSLLQLGLEHIAGKSENAGCMS